CSRRWVLAGPPKASLEYVMKYGKTSNELTATYATATGAAQRLQRSCTSAAAATARNTGTTITYRTPKSRAPGKAATSSSAGGSSTYGMACRAFATIAP